MSNERNEEWLKQTFQKRQHQSHTMDVQFSHNITIHLYWQ